MFRSLRSMIRSLTRIGRKAARRAAKPAPRMMAYRKFGLQLEHLEAREVPAVFITEIMYNSATSEPPGEWLEIANTGAAAVDISGWFIDDEDSGQWGAVPASTSLGVSQIAILFDSTSGTAANFRTQWAVPASALVIPITGWQSLGNSPVAGVDEILTIKDSASVVVDTVAYDDTAPWPTDPGGPSIYLTNISLNNDNGANWLNSVVGTANGRNPLTGAPYSTSDIGSPGQVPGLGVVTDAAISVANVSVIEGTGGTTTATVTLTRSGNTANTVSINYTTSPGVTNPAQEGTGSFVAGDDYLDVTSSVTFNPTETTKQFTIQINPDAVIEPNETISVTLSGVTVVTGGGTASIGGTNPGVVTITDDDSAAPVGLLLNEVYVNQPGDDSPNEYIEIINTSGTAQSLANVYVAVIEGDNTGGGVADLVFDLDNGNGPLTLAPGAVLTIRASGNNLTTWTSQPSFIDSRLGPVTPGSVIENGANTFMLLFGNTAPTETTDYDIGNTGTLTLPGGITVLDSVGYVDSDGPDFVYGGKLPRKAAASPDAITRADGFTVANSSGGWYYGDTVVGFPYHAYIPETLPGVAPAGAYLTPGAANVANAAGYLRFTAAGFSGSEGGPNTITVSVERVGGTAGDVSITVTTNDLAQLFPGTESFRATAGSDYTALFGTVLSWASGVGGVQTATITLADDVDVEGNEAFEVALSAPTGTAGVPTYQLTKANAIIAVSDSAAAAAAAGLVINEVKVDSEGFDHPTEYIEVLNTTGTAINLADLYVVSVEGEAGGGNYQFSSNNTVVVNPGNNALTLVSRTLVSTFFNDGDTIAFTGTGSTTLDGNTFTVLGWTSFSQTVTNATYSSANGGTLTITSNNNFNGNIDYTNGRTIVLANTQPNGFNGVVGTVANATLTGYDLVGVGSDPGAFGGGTTTARYISITIDIGNVAYAGPATLTGGSVIENGVTDPNKAGTFDYVFALGTGTVGAGERVLIKSPNYNPAGTYVAVNDSAFDTFGGVLENGTNSFLLVYSPAALTEATSPSGGAYQAAADYDQDNSGSLEQLPTGAVLLDGFGWSSGGFGDIVYGTFLTGRYTDFPNPGAATRLPGSGTPFSTEAWRTGDVYFANLNIHEAGYEAAASGELRYDYANSNAPGGGALTPGGVNFPAPAGDDNGSFRFTAGAYTVAENVVGGLVTLAVERVDNFAGTLSVTWTATNGTAQNADWGTGSGTATGTVTWAAGEGGVKTFTIAIADTAGYEGRETVNVVLTPTTAGVGVAAAASTATITILDNDAVVGDVPAGVLLNEVSVNPQGGDEANEYVEIINTNATAVTLRNVYFVSIEGDGTDGGTADVVIDLNDVTIAAGGILVLKAPNSTLTFGGAAVNNTTLFSQSGGSLENGTNTFALAWSDAVLVEGTDYDFDNNKTLELLPQAGAVAARLVDAVAWTDFGASDTWYSGGAVDTSLLIQPGSTPDAATRVVGNTTANNAASWYNGDLFGNTNTSVTYDSNISSASVDDNGGALPGPYTGFTALPSGAVLTPGAANYATPTTGVFSFAESTFTVTEGSGSVTLTVTVNRTGGTGAADVTWSIGDLLTGPGYAVVGSDTTGATTGLLQFTGSQTSQTFTVTIAGDGVAESNELFGLSLSGATNGAAIASTSLLQPTTSAAFNAIRYGTTAAIIDDDYAAALQGLVINEVKVDMAGTDGSYEYIEVRGTPGAVLPAGTYVVSVEGDQGGTTDAAFRDRMGTFDYVFDISGQTLHATTGLLIIKSSVGGHTPGNATVVTDVRLNDLANGGNDSGILENGSNSFLLINSPTALVQAVAPAGGAYELASDYDRDENGTLEQLPAGAVILDRLGWSNPGNGDFAYSVYLSYPFYNFAPPAAATRLASATTPLDKDAWRYGELTFDLNTQLTYDPTAGFNNVSTSLTGRALTPGAPNFDTGDTTPPALISFVRQTPAAATTNADSLVFRATFSEALLNIDAADFAVNSTTTATVTAVTLVSPGVYDITVSGGNLATFDGTVNLNLAAGQNITDAAGNALPAGEPGTDQTYTVDNTAPTVAVTDNVGGGPIASGGTVTFTLTFSEAVTGLEVGDFSNGASSPAAGTFGSLAGGPTVYTVVFTSTGALGGNLRLQVNNAGVVVQDTATNPLATPVQDDTTVVVNAVPTTFAVATTTLLNNGSGFLVTFNSAYDAAALNLYTGDSGGVLDARDVQVVGPTGNFGVDATDEIRFNAVPVNSTQLALIFTGPNRVAAAGYVPAGAYTVTLQGGTGSAAFKRLSDGAFLDGNGNGTVAADDDATANLTVTAPAATTAVVSIADAIIGPGQTVDVPLVLNGDVSDVTSVDLTFPNSRVLATPGITQYEVIGFTVNSAIPGIAAAFNPDTGILTMSSATPFQGNDNTLSLGTFQVRIPGLGNPGTPAAIGSKQLFDINVTSVADFAFLPKAYVEDDGFHLNAYLGDLSVPTGAYNGADTSQIQGIITQSIKALNLYQNADPRFLADVNKDGNVNGADTSNLQGRITGGTTVIPALPSGSGTVGAGGLDPLVYLDADGVVIAPGQQNVLIPVRVKNTDSTPISLAAADFVVEFDPAVFTFDAVLAGPLSDGSLPRPNATPSSAFSIAANVTAGVTAGNRLALRLTGSTAPNTGPGLAVNQDEIVYFLRFDVNANATLGNTQLNMLNDSGATILFDNALNQLALIPAPTDAYNEANDSTLTVQATSVRVFIPDNLPANPGQTVLVPFNIATGPTAQGIVAADLKFLFDPAKLTVTNVIAGDVADGTASGPAGGTAFSIAFNVPTPGQLIVTGSTAPNTGGTVPANTVTSIYFLELLVSPTVTAGELIELNVGNTVTFLADQAALPITISPAPSDTPDQPTVDGSLLISVPLNQPPFVNVPGSSLTPAANPQKALAGLPFALTAPITVSDANAADNIQLTLAVTTGTLSLSNTTGLTVSGNGTGTVVLTGLQGTLTARLATLTYTAPATFSGNVTLTATANDQGTGFGGPMTDTKTVNITAVRLRVSEVLFDPLPGDNADAPNEYIEIFSTAPNFTIPAGTYLVGLEGDSTSPDPFDTFQNSPGQVQDVFGLGGMVTGANGYLVLRQNASTYSSNGSATTYTAVQGPNSYTGFGFGGEGDIGAGNVHQGQQSIALFQDQSRPQTDLDVNSLPESSGDLENGSASFLLVRSPVAPVVLNDDPNNPGTYLGDDVDANNDGVLDGVATGWTVLDGVGVTDGDADDVAYGPIAFVGAGGVTTAGTSVSVGFDAGYVGRIGASLGSAATDWVAGVVAGTGPATFAASPSSVAGFNPLLNHLGSVNPAPIAQVTSGIVNGGGTSTGINGTVQRSNVLSYRVNFSRPVTIALANLASAVTLVQVRDGNGAVVSVPVTLTFRNQAGATITAGNNTNITALQITFNAGAATTGIRFGGSTLQGLIDGRYTLTVNSGFVTDTATGLALDGDANGTAGGNFTDNLFRFFGDFDGDGDVDNRDRARFNQAKALGPTPGTSGTATTQYWYFNSNSDSVFNGTDDTAFFLNFGRILP